MLNQADKCYRNWTSTSNRPLTTFYQNQQCLSILNINSKRKFGFDEPDLNSHIFMQKDYLSLVVFVKHWRWFLYLTHSKVAVHVLHGIKEKT